MFKLSAKIRTILGKKNQTLRSQGLIPAVVYGHKVKNQNILVEMSKFKKIFEQAGETSLISLEIDEQKPIKVIIQDISIAPLSGNVMHVDFHQVREDEELTVDVALEFVGESPAVKNLGGVLIKSLDAVKIQCLPADLVHKIEVDISALNNFSDIIFVKDLKISDKVKVLENPETPVVSIAEPRSEKELAELTEKPAEAALPEGAEEKPKEGEAAGEDKTDKKPADKKEDGKKE